MYTGGSDNNGANNQGNSWYDTLANGVSTVKSFIPGFGTVTVTTSSENPYYAYAKSQNKGQLPDYVTLTDREVSASTASEFHQAGLSNDLADACEFLANINVNKLWDSLGKEDEKAKIMEAKGIVERELNNLKTNYSFKGMNRIDSVLGKINYYETVNS